MGERKKCREHVILYKIFVYIGGLADIRLETLLIVLNVHPDVCQVSFCPVSTFSETLLNIDIAISVTFSICDIFYSVCDIYCL